MTPQLNAEQARVLGALLEKAAATPDHYPLTLNALRAACNQTSSRQPVVSYGEAEISEALAALREMGLVRIVYSPSNRAAKYRHVVDEALGLGEAERAVLCLLLLRGPQTVGELRTRSERIYPFDSLAAVEEVLDRLSSGPGPLVGRMPRGAGQKEARFAQLLTGEPPADWSGPAAPPAASGLGDRVQRLEGEVAELRTQVAGLQDSVERLQAELGG